MRQIIELDITADNATTGVLNTVKIVPIDLAGVTATLKNPLKLEEVSTKVLTANDLVFTKKWKRIRVKTCRCYCNYY